MKLIQYFCAAIVVLCNQVIFADECRPEAGSHSYLIGYGSLMNEKSLYATVKEVDVIEPVMVKGFFRSFNFNVDIYGLKTSMLNVFADQKAQMNAVLIGVDKEDLTSLDKRESGYCRKEVSKKDLTFYNDINIASLDGPVWIYVSEAENIHSRKDYKVPQSYVDLFLSGCLAIEETHALLDFAKECVLTTHGWDDKQFVNDRIYPRRPKVYQPKAMKIDKLLNELVPEVISSRKIES